MFKALVIIYCPRFNCLSEQRGLGFREEHRPTCSAAMYLVSLGLARVERSMGASHISILGL